MTQPGLSNSEDMLVRERVRAEIAERDAARYEEELRLAKARCVQSPDGGQRGVEISCRLLCRSEHRARALEGEESD